MLPSRMGLRNCDLVKIIPYLLLYLSLVAHKICLLVGLVIAIMMRSYCFISDLCGFLADLSLGTEWILILLLKIGSIKVLVVSLHCGIIIVLALIVL